MKEKTTEKKKWPLWVRILLIAISVLLVLALVLFVAYHTVLNYYLGKIQYETETFPEIYETEPLTEPNETIPGTAEEEEIKNEAEQMQGNNQIPVIGDSEHLINILLMGEDRSASGTLGRSDVMMLVSINTQTRKILLCSFMRDLCLQYPSEPQNIMAGQYTRLNAANPYGGPNLTLAVIKKNFNLDISYYAKVDFKAFAKVVDTIGGVEVDLTLSEIENINRHHKANAIYIGGKEYPIVFLPYEEGKHQLNGAHALTLARNREYDSDWQRTGRQRKIISAMIGKIPHLSLRQMLETMETLLPQIKTNLPKEKLKKMITSLPSYATYSIEQTSVPADGRYESVNYQMIPDLEYHQFYLYEKIMGQRAEGDPR